MAKPEITKDILIEELVNNYPFSVRYLMEKGIRCIMCGEPIWGTLEEAAYEKDFIGDDIDRFVSEMSALTKHSSDETQAEKKIDVRKME